MLKLIAALIMLIDHIGFIFFPTKLVFRIIGRLSMPIFAYCIARGFYYSKQHGTQKRYLLNMLAFALVSQLPYCLMIESEGLNIGFTWLLSLLLLFVSTLAYRSPAVRFAALVAALGLVCGFVYFGLLPVDYGIYGVITPLFFYLLIAHKKEGGFAYTFALLISWAVYVLVEQRTPGSLIQVVSVCSVPFLTLSKEFDEKVKLPKLVFYAFYPLHITVLLVLRYLL